MDLNLEIKIRIEGFNYSKANELIDRTSIKRVEHLARGMWSFTSLVAGPHRMTIGFIHSNKTNDPLHISLNLSALKVAEPNHWQTTLETLGVL